MTRRGAALLLLLLGVAPAVSEEALVDLRPRERADWNVRNVFAFLTSPVAFAYWYREPVVRIETVPADADVDLFYVRANFQHRFEQAKAPVRVRLPSRIESTSRDSLSVRVLAKGYATAHEVHRVHDVPGELKIELVPLPNALLALDASHLAGRTTFTFRTKGEPEFRIGRSGDDRFTLALHATANKLEAAPKISTPNVRDLDLAQLGEDLLVRIEGARPDLELRSRQRLDPARGEYLFTLDLQPKGFRLPSESEVRAIVERAREDATCDRAFEESLYAGIAEQGGKLTLPAGSLAELFAREIVLRVGRRDQGRLALRTGEALRIGSALELALALQSARDVRGYLGLLGAVARENEDPAGFARALCAPAMPKGEFDQALARAGAAFDACAR